LVPIQLRNNYSCSGNMNKILKLHSDKIITVIAKIIL
jgi:hypothetical protein